jgi:hypothetical protein
MKKLKLIPALEEAKTPTEHDAIWCGYIVTVDLGVTKQELKTETGVRGTVPVKVRYENGKAVIVGHEHVKII